MDGLSVIEGIAVAVILLILSRRLLDLALALLATISTLTVTMIGIVLSLILLLVLGVPVAIIGCEILKAHDGGRMVQTGFLYTVCRPKPAAPKIRHSAHVPVLPTPISAPGKY
jgi:hypothetical protein